MSWGMLSVYFGQVAPPTGWGFEPTKLLTSGNLNPNKSRFEDVML